MRGYCRSVSECQGRRNRLRKGFVSEVPIDRGKPISLLGNRPQRSGELYSIVEQISIFGNDSLDDNGWVEVWLCIDTNTLLQPGQHKIGDEIHSRARFPLVEVCILRLVYDLSSEPHAADESEVA